MNDYGFDYLNYITNIPNNMKMGSNINYVPNTKSKITMMNQTKVLEPYQGFIRGNIFTDQYDPYKNYKPMELNPNNEREALYYQLLQYKFALKDLGLYLDTHPNDQEILRLFQKYLETEKQIANKYESMYGPLTMDSSLMDTSQWMWKNNPWPWEGV